MRVTTVVIIQHVWTFDVVFVQALVSDVEVALKLGAKLFFFIVEAREILQFVMTIHRFASMFYRISKLDDIFRAQT